MDKHFKRSTLRLIVLMISFTILAGTLPAFAAEAPLFSCESDSAAAVQTSDTPDAAEDTADTPETPDKANEPQPAESPFLSVTGFMRIEKTGDLDSDGRVTSSDALIVLRVGIGFPSGRPELYPAGDIDADDTLSSLDALIILRFSIGLEERLTEAVDWRTLDGSYYAYDNNGAPLTGLKTVDGCKCLFDKVGKLITEDTEYMGRTIHIPENGVIPFGWQITEKGRAFFKDGMPLEGPCTVYGSLYCFKDGIAETGWRSFNGIKTYLDESGAAVSGWKLIDGKKYFFRADHNTVVGRCTLGGITYTFGDDGVLQNGWVELDSYKGFLADYELVKGEYDIGGKKYLFDDDGILRTGVYGNGSGLRLFDSFGFPCGGWADYDGKRYYFNGDGTPAEGFLTLDGVMRFFKKGIMQRDTTVKLYKIDSEGVCTKVKTVKPEQAKYLAEEIVQSVGKDPSALCNYVINHMTYMYVYIPEIYGASPEKADWDSIAAAAMNKGFGACYHFCSFLDQLYHAAGYETQLVVGTGYGTNLHSWNMIKLDGEWVNFDCGERFYGVSSNFLRSINWTFNYVFTRKY